MAATITATVGSASANSYVTLSTAESYMDERLDVDDWTAATDDEKNRALITAARRLDQETWRGRKADDDQALSWPRVETYDPDGVLYSSTAIPTPVQHAQMELALVLLGDDLLADTGLENFKAVKIGALDIETRPHAAGDLPANVRREIAHVLASAGGAQIRLQRG